MGHCRFSSFQSPEDIHPLTLSPPAHRYWSMGAYNNSKLCNVLFAYELARRWPSVSVFSCHPGNMVSSDLSRYSWMYRFLFSLVRPFTKSLVSLEKCLIYRTNVPRVAKKQDFFVYSTFCLEFRCEMYFFHLIGFWLFFFKQQAASTPVFCATAPELQGATGIYFNNCYSCESSSISQDSVIAARLWTVSQEMIINVVKREKLWYDLALK